MYTEYYSNTHFFHPPYADTWIMNVDVDAGLFREDFHLFPLHALLCMGFYMSFIHAESGYKDIIRLCYKFIVSIPSPLFQLSKQAFHSFISF